MSTTAALSKSDASQQQMQQQHQAASHSRFQHQGAQDVEEHSHKSSASASAGLNLNVFGALGGAFSSKSKKTTHKNPDGSSEAVEDRHDKGAAQAQAAGSANAYAAGNATDEKTHSKGRSIEQSQAEKFSSSASQQQAQQKSVSRVDHLGIEG